MSQLLETKSLLAKLMATENLHIEQKNVHTASFDVKNRILTVPILNSKIEPYTYDLFMGHEVGHALFTPLEEMSEAMKEGVNMSILNVVEDSRIERKIKYKYPGLKSSFIKAYNSLFQDDFFRTKDIDLNELNLIDRINMHCKVGASLNIQFTDEERELLNEIESTNTYKECVEITKRITKYMKEEMKKKQEEDQDDFDFPNIYIGFEEDTFEVIEEETKDVEILGDEGEEPDEEGLSKERQETESEESDGSGESSEDQEGEEVEEENQNGTFGADSQSEEEEDDETDEHESIKSSNGTNGTKSISDEDIRSHTDDAYRENESKLFAEHSHNIIYANLPKLDLDSIIVDFKEVYSQYEESINSKHYKNYDYINFDEEAYIKFKNENNKVVSYLVKEFELRKNAEQLKRATTSKTGELNMSKIYSYGFNDDIFKKVTVLPGGKSHGLMIYLDWSGSMNHHILNTLKQLLNLVLFCKKVNIPYEVYSFTNIDHFLNYDQYYKANDLVISNEFKLQNIFSSRMSASEFKYAATALFAIADGKTYIPSNFQMGGTPLNDTIIAAMDMVPEFQKKYRLQVVNTIFLTDGESNHLSGYFNPDKVGVSRFNGYSYANYSAVKNKLTITDPKTKFQATVDSAENSMLQTKALLELLKARTRTNVIGFYIIALREFRRQIIRYKPSCNSEEEYKVFKKNKYSIVDSAGFDDYYFLKSDQSNDDDEEFVTKSNTTRGIASAFAKYAGNKLSNRVVLNRFIGLIS